MKGYRIVRWHQVEYLQTAVVLGLGFRNQDDNHLFPTGNEGTGFLVMKEDAYVGQGATILGNDAVILGSITVEIVSVKEKELRTALKLNKYGRPCRVPADALVTVTTDENLDLID